MTYLSLFRKNLAALSAVFSAAVNAAPSTVGRYIARDPKFFDSCQRNDIRVGTYDFVVARFSALWPENLPWPEGIDRPDPSPIEPETLEWFRPRIETNPLPPEWPKNQPWPDDIEKPERIYGEETQEQ